MLRVHNTLTGEKEEFVPINASRVGMYNCGPTVYNYAHIGNLRAYVFADTIRRTLELNGYKVDQVINITDVGHLTSDADSGEDKIEKATKREKKTAGEIAEFYTKEFLNDLADLNIETGGTRFPKATEHIPEQIALIQKLEKGGHTYKTTDGIYFDTSTFKDYGKLGNINLAGLKEGARVEANSEKRNITDFALWKFSPESATEKREQEWNSPWGVGFPGWHIECSAMSMKYLGETFDIHTGGIDHIPVHHNNEIAQSECATGKPFARYWLHSAFVNVEGGKMAKSEGNFLRLADIKKEGISPLAYRYWLLGAHYSTQVTFSLEAVKAAEIALNKLIAHYAALSSSLSADSNAVKADDTYKAEFKGYINDNFNTPQAIALMWELSKDKEIGPAVAKATFVAFDSVLGLNLAKSAEKSDTTKLDMPEEVRELVAEREKARKEKNYTRSDELRIEIEKLGFFVKDGPSGPVISK